MISDGIKNRKEKRQITSTIKMQMNKDGRYKNLSLSTPFVSIPRVMYGSIDINHSVNAITTVLLCLVGVLISDKMINVARISAALINTPFSSEGGNQPR